MIKIDIDEIEKIKAEFLNRIKSKTREGIKYGDKRDPKDVDAANELFRAFNDNINNIILCEPNKKALELIRMFRGIYRKSNNGFNLFKYYMEGQYNDFIANHGYWLSESLRVNVCPYCNRQYTFTTYKSGKNKGVRPQFDHFLPKSKYPYFALSFYNLIPSCPTCNHAKGEDKIKINPYVNGFGTKCKFTIDKLDKCILNSNRDLWNINLPAAGTHVSHINAFALDSLYNQHKDYIEEMVTKARSYNEGYYKSLKTSFLGLGLSEREMSLLIFGNYISTNDFDKRPLSKLSADILEQLEVNL